MNGSINSPTTALLHTRAGIFVLISFSMLLLLVAVKWEIVDPTAIGTALNFLLAPVTAAVHTVRNGIAAFAGHGPIAVPISDRLSVVGSLIVLFVAGPAALVMVRKEIAVKRRDGKPLSFTLKFLNVIIIGGSVIIPSLLIATTLATNSVSGRMRAENEISMQRQSAVMPIASISYNAQQFFQRPTTAGGGGESFRRGGSTVTLYELGMKTRTSDGRYVLYPGSNDTTLKVLFFGNTPLPQHSGKNDVRNRFIELEATITPTGHLITTVQ